MKRIDLPVPYLSQRDNERSPGGTCNVTSVAMVLKFYGLVGDGTWPQIEDQLSSWLEAHGLDRHSPYDLVKIFQMKGLMDEFTGRGTWEQLLAHLQSGNPVIVHGDFTASGHVLVVRGWDPDVNELIINDPAGEWHESDGYARWRAKPAGNGSRWHKPTFLRYATPDGLIWMHLPKRK